VSVASAIKQAKHNCCRNYPACKPHVTYYVICGLSGPTIFSTHLTKGTIFWKALLNIKCVFYFSLQPCPKYFCRWRIRGDIINVCRSSRRVPVILVIFKWNLILEILSKNTNIKFHENPYIGSRRTGRHNEAFHNFVNAPKNYQQWAKWQRFDSRKENT
jgi:hypothetical protein